MAEEKKSKTTFTAKDIEENKVVAAFSYLWILSVVFLLVKKDSPYTQFHAKQGLVIFIAFIILGFIPILGWIVDLFLTILIIVGFFQAISGKAFKIPGVWPIAEKINL